MENETKRIIQKKIQQTKRINLVLNIKLNFKRTKQIK